MIPRYTPGAIAVIFDDGERLRRWLEVEVLAVEGWAEVGRVPPEDATAVRAGARVDPARVAALEAEQGHDVAAFVSAVQETLGPEGRWVHFGMTSSDLVDTTLGWQLRDAAEVVDGDLAALEAVLAERAVEHRTTPMVGRTHGVHAEPLTLGVKLANHYDEVRRCRRRLAAAASEVAVGRISGAVGTHATVDPGVETYVCSRLGLAVAPVTTQVVARDRHAAFVAAIAVLGGVLERLATAIRLLQTTEVGEAEEPFAQRQKGSSAMPHKRNPVLCERVCGMARVLRGHAQVALEDIALWHERDISHSSAERIVLPDSCALASYTAQVMTRVVRGLRVDRVRMRANLEHGGGLVCSQRVLVALVDEAGWPRERAYRAVQTLALEARQGRGGFRDLVGADADIAAALGAEALARALDPAAATAHVDETFRRLGLAVQEPSAGVDEPGRPAVAVEAGIGGGVQR